MTNALTNMKNFRSNSKLQEASYLFMLNYLTSKEEKNELLKTFL
jgi:calcium-dependent protein kinase